MHESVSVAAPIFRLLTRLSAFMRRLRVLCGRVATAVGVLVFLRDWIAPALGCDPTDQLRSLVFVDC
uniref:Secreted protein n=1 Tax=Steinernema glaseri TaxID=37863 RepID=A0A1I7ZYS2_9BILA